MGRRRLEPAGVSIHSDESAVFRQRVHSEPLKANESMLDKLDMSAPMLISKPVFQSQQNATDNQHMLQDNQQHPYPCERRSSRAIRRKKFDDEVVDNSNAYTKKKIRTLSESICFSDKLMKENFIESMPKLKKPEALYIKTKIDDVFLVSKVSPPVVSPKAMKHMKESPKLSSNDEDDESDDDSEVLEDGTLLTERCQKSEFPSPSMFDDVYNFWTPQDDLALILNILQTSDPKTVYDKIKFTQNFTLSEILDRWSLLLYDKVTSNISIEAIRQLHKCIVNEIEKESVFSEQEDELLRQVSSNVLITFDNFQRILASNPDVFLPARQPEDLYKRWAFLHSKHLLNDQSDVLDDTFTILDKPCIQYRELSHTTTTDDVESKLGCLRKFLLSKIHEFRELQHEIKSLTALNCLMTGINPIEFEPDVYAYLRGSRVRFPMKIQEVTLGRRTMDIDVDFDLAQEGFSKHISRFQAVINLLPMGRFLIYNAGRHSFSVNSMMVETESAAELHDESLIIFDGLMFLFRINKPKIDREFRKINVDE